MKKLIAGLMCMFVVSQGAFAEIETVSMTESGYKADTEFKVSREQLWAQSLVVVVVIGIIEGIVVGTIKSTKEPDLKKKEISSIVHHLVSLIMSIHGAILMFGRQNDAGVSGLSRFNPFTNIKIAFCKTA